jgi:transcription elongation GreA/GreB family factor
VLPQDAINAAAGAALAAPAEHLELFLWLYKGPARPPANLPGKVELLSRLLAVLQEIDHDWSIDAARRKAIRHRIRAALSAGDCAAYRQAVGQMDLPVAGTFKGRIERSVGLAQAVREDMLNILRESFYALFAKAKVAPWLDETTIWTSQQALDARQKALKELVEVKMLENARAIGAAAEHGDLSENSEWKFALEERDLLRARVAKMQQELALARVIRPDDVPADSVGIGSRVLLRRVADGRELTLTFLGLWDSDLGKGVYSYQAALAADLMGKAVGDAVTVKLEGLEGQYHIEQISSAVK